MINTITEQLKYNSRSHLNQLISCLRLFAMWIILCSIQHTYSQMDYDSNSFLEKARDLKYKKPDTSIYYFEKSIALYKSKKDTFNLINSIYELSQLYGHNVDYGKAYDGYWEALILAESSKDQFSKAKVHQALGWLYISYRRDREALENLNLSLKINKELYKQKEITLEYIDSDYFSLINFYRINKDYRNVKKYLDSFYSHPNIHKNYYLESESGFLLATENRFPEALEKLNAAKTFFENNDQSYLIIIHSLLGKVYQMQNNTEKSEFHYKKSLELSERLISHTNYKIINHKELSELYYNSKKHEKAFYHIKKAIDLEDEIYGRKSQNNQYLFEIKDKYRLQKEKQMRILEERHLTELEHEKNVSFLKFVLLLVILGFMILYGFLLYKNLKRKHKNEKAILGKKQELELQKTNEILELKNKELTKSALQLIEKEEFIYGLKDKFNKNKENIDVKVIDRMLRTIQGSAGGNWKEFEARFTDINQSFYKNLKEKHPDLSQTDLKICALVKLNFSSKDMSSLLGISIESVHTSRYRLRKKLALNRNDNLVEYISNI